MTRSGEFEILADGTDGADFVVMACTWRACTLVRITRSGTTSSTNGDRDELIAFARERGWLVSRP